MKQMHRILAAALASAALSTALPAAAADYSKWIYSDNGSANRTPASGVSATWSDLFHWEWFAATVQRKINHFPGTVLIIQ